VKQTASGAGSAADLRHFSPYIAQYFAVELAHSSMRIAQFVVGNGKISGSDGEIPPASSFRYAVLAQLMNGTKHLLWLDLDFRSGNRNVDIESGNLYHTEGYAVPRLAILNGKSRLGFRY
jgi:hypothetical protein